MEPRPIPGTIAVPGRGFAYVEAPNQPAFDSLFDELGVFIERTARPLPNGGIVTTNAVITLPSGVSLFGLSFKGDVSRWEEGVLRFAEERGLVSARIRDANVVTNNGTSTPLEACRIDFYGFKS